MFIRVKDWSLRGNHVESASGNWVERKRIRYPFCGEHRFHSTLFLSLKHLPRYASYDDAFHPISLCLEELHALTRPVLKCKCFFMRDSTPARPIVSLEIDSVHSVVIFLKVALPWETSVILLRSLQPFSPLIYVISQIYSQYFIHNHFNSWLYFLSKNCK